MENNIMEEKKSETEKSEKKQENAKTETTTKNVSEKQKNKNAKKIPFIIVGIIFIMIVIFSTIFAIININNTNIISGVKIQGIDVSGLSSEDAISKLELIYNEKKQKEIVLKYEEYDATINPELIEANYDIESAVEEAISLGKNGNIVKNNYNILLALIGKKNIDINVNINEEITEKTIEDIGTNIEGAVVEPGYYVEEDKLIITKGKEGLKVDSELLMIKIKEGLIDNNTNLEYIEMPVYVKKPEEIDIEKIYEEVHKEVQDAYYTNEPFTIHPEVEGIDFNLDEAKIMLQEDKEQYEIQLVITKPKVTTSQIGSEAFPDLLATYSTKYDGSDVNRTTNLRIAVQKINDKVVLPGETFSYNQALGKRTEAAGYKNAKVYENGQVVDGIGGGICQISSTLYNSVLMANMGIVERRNHQFVTSYTPAGRDATVVYGLTDFRFKNTRTYAIKIKASISNGIATVSIYGIKEENEYKVTFSTKTISSIPYTVKYVDDNTLDAGTEKVKQKGANGIITETYIIKSLNGKVVSTELLSKDTYNAMQRIILKGTKTTANSSTETNNKPENTTNNNSGNSQNNTINNNKNNTVNNGDGNMENNNTLNKQNNVINESATNNLEKNTVVENKLSGNTL